MFGKKKVCSLPMVKRMFSSILLGLVFGFFCAFLAWKGGGSGEGFWGSALMWSMVFNRFLIGFVLAFAGFVTLHPIFKIRMYPVLRGICVGTLVSLDISFGPFIAQMPNAWNIFAATLIAGAIYGAIIDVVATKVGGEGKALVEGTQK